MLRDHFGVISRDAADGAVSACDGNPLLLELALQNPGSAPAGGPVPAEVTRRMLLARFSAADSVAQRYVRAASVLGTRFRPAVAAAIADLPAAQAADTLEDLFSADLLRGDDAGWVRFRHALVRQAIYDDLAPPARAYLHERALRALLAAGVAIGEAAEHAIAAGLPGDAQAIDALTSAGRAALHAGAVQAARRYLDAAVGLAGDGAAAALQVDLAKALLACGSGEAATAVLDRILARPGVPAPARLSAQLLLGQAAFNSGAVERAGELFDAVATASAGGHADIAVKALLDHTLQSWARLGPRAALPVAVRARGLAADADAYPEDAPRRPGRYAPGCRATRTGCRPRRLRRAASPHRHPLPAARAGAWTRLLCPPTSRCGRSVSRSASVCSPGLAEDRAEPFLLFHAAFSSSDALCRLGRLAEALAMAERACDVAELLPVGLPLARAGKGLALLEAGRTAEAAACEDPAASPAWYLATGCQLRLSATAAFRQGRIDAACTAFGLLEQRLSEWGVADPSHIPYAADAIGAYLAAGRLDDAGRVVDRLAKCRLPSRWPAAVAAAGRAACAMHDGDLVTAEPGFARAVGLIGEVPMPLAQCWTLTWYGAVLTRRGQREKARRILGHAVRQAQSCGAGWHAGQALAGLRRAGGRSGGVPAGQLSPQERPSPGSPTLAGRTGRSAASCSCRSTRSRPTCRTSTASSASAGAASSRVRT